MKKLALILCILLPTGIIAQVYDVTTWNYNDEIVNGIKIKTQLPFTNDSQMPTIFIEGYDYGNSVTIGLKIAWGISSGSFVSATASSSGGVTPDITLSAESGKVNIHLGNFYGYYTRFKITAFAKGMGESSSWFTGWTISDDTLSGTAKMPVSYFQMFKNSLIVDGVFAAGTVYSDYLNSTRILSSNIQTSSRADQGNVNSMSRNHFSQNAYVSEVGGIGNPDPPMKSYNSKSVYGTAVVWETDGIGGKAMNILVDSTISGANETLSFTNIFTITTDGRVGIGTSTPQSLLAVNGDVYAKKLKCTQTGWPDYVFEPGYQLRPLSHVEQYIKEHKHLPDVPAAKEVIADGNDVGKTQAILLQKVEELTLYVIEQNKKIQRLEKQIRKIKKTNSSIR